MDLAAPRAGAAPTRVVEATLQILLDIDDNSETEPQGGVRPRIGFMDDNIPNHHMHSGWVDGFGSVAFKKTAAIIAEAHEVGLTQSPHEAWDRRVDEETRPIANGDDPFSIEQVPIQMFGAGQLFQRAAEDCVDKVLLLQLGDGFGTPIRFMEGDMVVQIWIEAEDLARGRFDRIEATIDMG